MNWFWKIAKLASFLLELTVVAWGQPSSYNDWNIHRTILSITCKILLSLASLGFTALCKDGVIIIHRKQEHSLRVRKKSNAIRGPKPAPGKSCVHDLAWRTSRIYSKIPNRRSRKRPERIPQNLQRATNPCLPHRTNLCPSRRWWNDILPHAVQHMLCRVFYTFPWISLPRNLE